MEQARQITMCDEDAPACRRILVPERDDAHWILLLDPERAAGRIMPVPGDPVFGRRGGD
jgi:hypothetical protein